MPIRWNPLEGSSSGPCQVGLRGNVDYQSMLRTLQDGFHPDLPDLLRTAPVNEGEHEADAAAALEEFESALPAKVKAVAAERRKKGLEHKTSEEIAEQLRDARNRRAAAETTGGPMKRFARWVRTIIVDAMKNSIQAMFYACDYSTKPNMTCSAPLVALRGGVRRIEEEFKRQEEEAQAAEMSGEPSGKAVQAQAPTVNKGRQLSKLQDEARRRLIRLATAANQAIVKGSCLMVMQMLSGREVLRSHFPWQLMMKHSMWMALQHRRELQGFDEREPQEDVGLSLVEGDVAEEETEAEDVESQGPEASMESDSTGSGEEGVKAAGDVSTEPPVVIDPGVVIGGGPSTLETAPSDPSVQGASSAAGNAVRGECQETVKDMAEVKVKLRVRSDTFYDDYLHRGDCEPGSGGTLRDTPLRNMSLYCYAMFVRIVEGDPEDLGPNQYAFSGHHSKKNDYVQELRPSPSVPFIHGFTMPTVTKDAETNACFKQVLLRPHHCSGSHQCRRVDFTRGFCQECRSSRSRREATGQVVTDAATDHVVKEVISTWSFVPPWTHYHAQQLLLAQRADRLLEKSCKIAVLPDITSLRQWWLPTAVRHSIVQDTLVPWLMGLKRHDTDSALRGTWCRRDLSAHFMQESARPCWRARLPESLAWLVLRFAGHVVQDDGSVLGIANTNEELAALRKDVLGNAKEKMLWDGAVTSPGAHDEQLSAEELFALRNIEVAARLEYMGEARGRPRPGQPHPDAEVEEHPECALGGDRQDSDPEFEKEMALPGADGEVEEAAPDHALDLEWDYKAKHPVGEDELEDIVHRTGDAAKHIRSKQRTAKKELLSTFMSGHKSAYANARAVHKSTLCTPALHPSDPHTRREASERQRRLLEELRVEGLNPDKEVPPMSLAAIAATPDVEQRERSRQLDPAELPRSPIDVALELIATSGVWRNKEQYLATLFILQPVQQLWEGARRQGKLHQLHKPDVYSQLTCDMRARRVFLHGPGGSGKTFCMTEVVMKVVKQFFGRRALKAVAAANSAARLLEGKTMHAAGKMTRKQSLKARNLRPRKKAKDALANEWYDALMLLADEIGTAAPPLFAGVSRRASHGRREAYKLDMARAMEQPFGETLLQVVMGDFLQLNPVASHTLLESLLSAGTRVPGVPRTTTDEDRDGYSIFRKVCENVVLFTGTHRFLDEDLPRLLEIMRTKGGAEVPEELRARIRERTLKGESDPRLSSTYEQEGQMGFFAYGARAAIQWEQVARLQQLHVVASARVCPGATAAANDAATGKPDAARPGSSPSPNAGRGQLVYYFQAVDAFKHPQSRDVHMEALKYVNLTKSAGLQGVFSGFLGMRVRITKKLLPPKIVQEATGEVVGIAFHPNEKFGGGHGSSNLRPADDHPCWQTGYVKCDYLPLHVEVRLDGCTEDFTGLGKPGVWHVEPATDDWKLPYQQAFTIDHPNVARARRVKATSRKGKFLDAWRTQVPLAPEHIVTFQNIQGQTIKGPQDEAKGFVLDFFRPWNMSGDDGSGRAEYFQHLYMGLGRARRLDRILIRNFPQDASGDLDWSFFEDGPPDYIVEFMEALEARARRTLPKLLRAQTELGVPAWKDVPNCDPDPDNEGRFLYDPAAWGRQAAKSFADSPKKRFRGKQDPPSPAVLRGAKVEARTPACSPPPKKGRTEAPTPAASSQPQPPPQKRQRQGSASSTSVPASLQSTAAAATPPLRQRDKALLLRPVAPQLQRAVRTHMGTPCRILSREAGGGGDCLFLSFAAVLLRMMAEGGAAAAHVRSKLPEATCSAGRDAVARHLRNMSAQRFDDWSWEDLLNYVLRAVQDEDTGFWEDLWSPRALLERSALTALVGYEAVAAIGASVGGDVGDIVFDLVVFDRVVALGS